MLKVGENSSGESVYENVLCEVLDEGKVKLLHTPGLALDVAFGDVIRIDPGDRSFEVVARAGNVAIQIYGPRDVAMSVEADFRNLGGWYDGGLAELTIFTVPASAGFPAIEAILYALAAKHDIEWYYGNVYGEDGVTPLNWWAE